MSLLPIYVWSDGGKRDRRNSDNLRSWCDDNYIYIMLVSVFDGYFFCCFYLHKWITNLLCWRDSHTFCSDLTIPPCPYRSIAWSPNNCSTYIFSVSFQLVKAMIVLSAKLSHKADEIQSCPSKTHHWVQPKALYCFIKDEIICCKCLENAQNTFFNNHYIPD